MTTFKGIFTTTVPTVEDLDKKLHYTFNTEHTIYDGMVFKTSKYGSEAIYVTEILEKEYKYFNKKTKTLHQEKDFDCIPLAIIEDLQEISMEELSGEIDILPF